MKPCTHCGTPVEGVSEDQKVVFCCMGCERVHHLIHSSGLETFYQVKSLDACDIESGAVTTQRDVDDATISLIMTQATEPIEGIYRVTVSLEGLHCAGCVWLIEQLPHHLSGVHSASVSWSTHQLELSWDDRTTLEHIADWLAKYGYHLHPVDHTHEHKATTKPLLRRVGVTWAVAANVMLLSLTHYTGLTVDGDPMLFHGSRVLAAALSTLALVYGADIFLRRAWLSIRGSMQQGTIRWSMDVPLSLGVLLMWVVSVVNAIRGVGDIWFDSMTMLTAALLTSRWLQLRANISARRATERLFSLLPKTARVIDESGQTQILPSDALEPGMRVQVRAGELFPADGKIVWGQTMVHRGALTGESRPEPITSGEQVEAGVQNVQDTVILSVEAAGDGTQLGQLQTWVKDHAKRRAPMEMVVDRYGSWFVLAVVLVATLTMFIARWYGLDDGLQRAVAILVVSCPCALAMATPLTLAMGMGQAANMGMFIKYDDVMELLAKVDTIIFDKTGTLTHGQMTLVTHHGQSEPLVWAAALEYGDNHPIAQGIYNSTTVPAGLDIRDIERTPGHGVEGVVEGHHVIVGAPNWVLDRCDDPVNHASQWTTNERHTPIYIAVDGILTTMLCLGDSLRSESPALIERLRQQNVQTVLLSGDDAKVVEHVGVQLNMDAAIGGVTHTQKGQYVQALQEQGHVVMMIGDGVNDAMALQMADVGVAMNNSAQISLQACDVFLHHQNNGPLLHHVAQLREGALRVIQTVRRTVAYSALYNAIAIVFAALGFISPLVAAILMPISSLTVVVAACFTPTFRQTASQDAPHDINPKNTQVMA